MTNFIYARDLISNETLLNDMLQLVERVYDSEHAGLFLEEMRETPDAIVAFISLDNKIIGLGCICESHISFGVYELFWGMVDERYRGNGWGKILVDERIKYVLENKNGKSTPTDIIVVTTKPWHLDRCGFEVLKKLNNEGELLMYRRL